MPEFLNADEQALWDWGGGVDLICNSSIVLTCHVSGNYPCPCPYCILINMVKEYIIIHCDSFLKFIFKIEVYLVIFLLYSYFLKHEDGFLFPLVNEN